MVRLGQPRRRASSSGPTSSSSTANGRASTCRSASASTAAWGNRLAELQLRIVWEEILKRFSVIEVMGRPKRVYSSFVRGIEQLPVRIPG